MTSTPSTPTPSTATTGSRSPLRVVKDQRKTILVAVVLAVAAYWIAGQLGEWRLASAIAIA